LGGLVLLASVIIGLAGIAGFILGFAGLLPGVDFPSGSLFLGGLLYLILATILGVAGVGLLSLRGWAWWLAAITALAALVWQAYGIYRAPESVPWTSWVAIVVTGAIFVYLLTVYRSFHRHVAAVPA
jgi:uncharacterized membrane protein (DUF2068 family)